MFLTNNLYKPAPLPVGYRVGLVDLTYYWETEIIAEPAPLPVGYRVGLVDLTYYWETKIIAEPAPTGLFLLVTV
jgi:hypothetical protein